MATVSEMMQKGRVTEIQKNDQGYVLEEAIYEYKNDRFPRAMGGVSSETVAFRARAILCQCHEGHFSSSSSQWSI
jgi:hypothetical protein